MSSERRLYIAVPTYNGQISAESFDGLHEPSRTASKLTVQRRKGSLLAYVFNILWLGAYNSRHEYGWTHFAMHHADIQTEPFWADKLMDELEASGADVLSVVVPIKDQRGLTSTGLVDPDDGSIRRLTMKEVAELPPVFGAEEAVASVAGAKPGSHLSVNTGLWLCNFTKLAPFIRPKHMDSESVGSQFVSLGGFAKLIPFVRPNALGDDAGLHFSILDGVREEANGSLTACVLPEDWNFSRSCRTRGLKVMATRSVTVYHHGEGSFPNQGAWGEWEVDRGDAPLLRSPCLAPGDYEVEQQALLVA